MEQSLSGVGVIDKAATVLGAVEAGGASLNELVDRTGLSRATAHRLAAALEVHGLLRRSADGRFALGPRLITLGETAAAGWPLADASRPALAWLRDETGESAQLFVRQGDARVCLASLQSPHGLRTIVTAGAILAIDQGSGGRVLQGDVGIDGWVATVAEREAGVASVSAPVHDRHGRIVAAVSVSGPIERLTKDPGPTYGPSVAAAATRVAQEAGLQ
ncbi:MAG: IclR family transcriptional regulator [Actinomycetota bacterium]